MVNLGPSLQVGNFASRENQGDTLLRIQKAHLVKLIWIDLVDSEVEALSEFLITYLKAKHAGETAPEAFITEVRLMDQGSGHKHG